MNKIKILSDADKIILSKIEKISILLDNQSIDGFDMKQLVTYQKALINLSTLIKNTRNEDIKRNDKDISEFLKT